MFATQTGLLGGDRGFRARLGETVGLLDRIDRGEADLHLTRNHRGGHVARLEQLDHFGPHLVGDLGAIALDLGRGFDGGDEFNRRLDLEQGHRGGNQLHALRTSLLRIDLGLLSQLDLLRLQFLDLLFNLLFAHICW